MRERFFSNSPDQLRVSTIITITTSSIITTTTRKLRVRKVPLPKKAMTTFTRHLKVDTIMPMLMERLTSIIITARKVRKAKKASVETKEVAVALTVETTSSESTTRMKRASL